MKPCYCNDLDFVAGIAYCLTSRKISCEYRVSPETFYVVEEVDWGSLGFNDSSGEYVVIRVEKKNIDTLSVAEIISRRLRVPKTNLLYLGLKDKHSSSIQYFFLKKSIVRMKLEKNMVVIEDKNLVARVHGFVKKKPGRRYLLGNMFKIFIGGDEGNYRVAREIVGEIVDKGLPSYYGYQRFGVTRPNTHYIGKLLLQGRVVEALNEFVEGVYLSESIESIRSRIDKKFLPWMKYESLVYSRARRSVYDSWSSLEPGLSSLLVEAFQSYIFNRVLTKYIRLHGGRLVGGEICVPGYNCFSPQDILFSVLREEGLSPSIFSSRSVRGWFRKTLFKPYDVSFKHDENGFWLLFRLEKGFYATIVLRELFKENLVLL